MSDDQGRVNMIECCGLKYDVEIGFHDYEKKVPQKVLVDFRALFSSQTSKIPDETTGLIIDYYLANQLIADLLKGFRFKLLEAAGSAVAELLLEKFPIEAVEVRITKFPLDMPNTQSVSFWCRRDNK